MMQGEAGAVTGGNGFKLWHVEGGMDPHWVGQGQQDSRWIYNPFVGDGTNVVEKRLLKIHKSFVCFLVELQVPDW